MQCSYCLRDIHPIARVTTIEATVHPKIESGQFAGDEYQFWARLLVCPGCHGAMVILDRYNFGGYKYDSTLVYPKISGFKPAPEEVPSSIGEDFNEANLVLGISPKASAALSRRCLQAILYSHGYLSKDLVKQVDAAINESDPARVLPLSIRENMDAIRNFGDFSAHPITDLTSLQIVEVERGEAEWCLEILRDLFEHYYVGPARSAERRAALASKLSSAGKPPMKA